MSDFRDPRELRLEADRLNATAAAIEDGTWAAVVQHDPTPGELAECIDCSVAGANNRLRRLYDLGLLDRRQIKVAGGGRQFRYRLRLDESA